MTVAVFTAFDVKALYVGAAFDESKLKQYRLSVNDRVGFAQVFPNFIKGIAAQIALWPEHSLDKSHLIMAIFLAEVECHLSPALQRC